MKNYTNVTKSMVTLGPKMGIFVGLGFSLGHYGDIYYNTKPVLAWCGIFVGIALAGAALACATLQAKKQMTTNSKR